MFTCNLASLRAFPKRPQDRALAGWAPPGPLDLWGLLCYCSLGTTVLLFSAVGRLSTAFQDASCILVQGVGGRNLAFSLEREHGGTDCPGKKRLQPWAGGGAESAGSETAALSFVVSDLKP